MLSTFLLGAEPLLNVSDFLPYIPARARRQASKWRAHETGAHMYANARDCTRTARGIRACLLGPY